MFRDEKHFPFLCAATNIPYDNDFFFQHHTKLITPVDAYNDL